MAQNVTRWPDGSAMALGPKASLLRKVTGRDATPFRLRQHLEGARRQHRVLLICINTLPKRVH
jgi:hypothetical protein